MGGAGLPAILGASAGLIVWGMHFGLLYAANAVACARRLDEHSLLGQPLVPAFVLMATALALAAVALIGARAWRRLRPGGAEDAPRFLARLSLSIALLSALAILWEGLPALLVRPCG